MSTGSSLVADTLRGLHEQHVQDYRDTRKLMKIAREATFESAKTRMRAHLIHSHTGSSSSFAPSVTSGRSGQSTPSPSAQWLHRTMSGQSINSDQGSQSRLARTFSSPPVQPLQRDGNLTILQTTRRHTRNHNKAQHLRRLQERPSYAHWATSTMAVAIHSTTATEVTMGMGSNRCGLWSRPVKKQIVPTVAAVTLVAPAAKCVLRVPYHHHCRHQPRRVRRKLKR